jgi:hypothetical protein
MRRTNLPFIEFRRDINLVNETVVTIAYTTWPTGTLVDGTTQSKIADSDHQPTFTSMAAPAFIHHIAATGVNQVRQYNECEVGDAIVVFGPTVDFSGKEDFKFTFDGADWVQKQISSDLALKWGSLVMGTRLFQVFLLRKATA